MIVCHCAAVSDRAINKLIEAGASSVREITRLCGAGRCCAPCRGEIASLIASSQGTPPPPPAYLDLAAAAAQPC